LYEPIARGELSPGAKLAAIVDLFSVRFRIKTREKIKIKKLAMAIFPRFQRKKSSSRGDAVDPHRWHTVHHAFTAKRDRREIKRFPHV
jgi:hypothetical protein